MSDFKSRVHAIKWMQDRGISASLPECHRFCIAVGDLEHGGQTREELRDHFAGQALPAIIRGYEMDCSWINEPHLDRTREGETMADMIAQEAYGIADAMLAEREKGEA